MQFRVPLMFGTNLAKPASKPASPAFGTPHEASRFSVYESVMAADPLDDYIDAIAKALALPIKDAWKPAVRANLEVSLRLARRVDEFPLADETESASVYSA